MHPSRTDIIVYRKAKLRIVENALVASKLAIFFGNYTRTPLASFSKSPLSPFPKVYTGSILADRRTLASRPKFHASTSNHIFLAMGLSCA